MFAPVVTKNPAAVETEVQAAYRAMFPDADPSFVPRLFGWIIECFTRGGGGYQPVDVGYHDFEHTLQGALCLARLLRARHVTGVAPVLTARQFQLAIVAILLHDAGYLKTKDDREGTGAKYTITHVARGAEFAARLLGEKGFPPAEIRAVQNMIHCTGVNAMLEHIPFQNETEKLLGCAVGTADLLGQMAAADYVDKLPALYAEFEEAVRFTGDRRHFVASFASAADLMRNTPAFWNDCVRPKLDRDFGGLYRFLNDPYPDGPNEYLERIEANVERVRRRMAPAGAA